MGSRTIPLIDQRQLGPSWDLPLPLAAPTGLLRDQRQRPLRDLRISVTDRCNFRCNYCMPKEVFDSSYTYLPQSSLLTLSPVPRFIAAVALAFAPIFLANLIFAQRFQDVGSSTTAFAANLLGAIVGGGLEYTALVTGYRFLLVVVAILYGLALGARPATSPMPAA